MKQLKLCAIALLIAACTTSTDSTPQRQATGQAESSTSRPTESAANPATDPTADRVEKTDAEWRQQLSDEQFRITRKAGTERAFSGEYWNEKRAGSYLCRCCDYELFHSESKYKSGTGWPSFWEPSVKGHVAEDSDYSIGGVRTEVLCARCDAHLGHVFTDGPEPTGLRYCINSASLVLRED